MIDLSSYIRDVPDFPKPGIVFKDVTPLLRDPEALRAAMRLLTDRVAAHKPDLVVGVESRGFIFGAAVADRLGAGFAPARKPGKLPHLCVREDYALEYGSGTLEMHADRLDGKRAVVIDDLLATGGTAACAARLCRRLGAAVVGFAFVIELSALGGRAALGDAPVDSLLTY